MIVGIAAIGLGKRVFHDWTKARDPAAHSVEVRGELRGTARVADGDSLSIEGTRLRLVGIDAPEIGQSCLADGRDFACGVEARKRLEALIADRPVACVWDRLDKYGRGLARCRAASVDLGTAMVRDGWAVAYGGHEAEEAEARRDRRGLWATRFEWPEDFRRRERGTFLLDGGER